MDLRWSSSTTKVKSIANSVVPQVVPSQNLTLDIKVERNMMGGITRLGNIVWDAPSHTTLGHQASPRDRGGGGNLNVSKENVLVCNPTSTYLSTSVDLNPGLYQAPRRIKYLTSS